MSTAPIIAPELPATWAGQLPALLKKYRNFATRAEAHGDLVRMASGRDARRRSPRYQ